MLTIDRAVEGACAIFGALKQLPILIIQSKTSIITPWYFENNHASMAKQGYVVLLSNFVDKTCRRDVTIN